MAPSLYSTGQPRMMNGLLMLLLLLMLMLTVTVKTQVLDSEITDAVQNIIVMKHNSFRSRVRDASNMLKMRWDVRLEAEAAKFVNGCHYELPVREKRKYGQTIYRSEFNWQHVQIAVQALNSWNLESVFRLRSTMKCCATNVSQCCNEQQMIWANTRRVGCALKKCKVLTAPDKPYPKAWLMTCMYHPKGNDPVEEAFKTGGHCKECPTFFTKCDPDSDGLCDKLDICKGDL